MPRLPALDKSPAELSIADLFDDQRGAVQHIGVSEAQQPHTGVEQFVLAAVVLGQRLTMDATVVLDAESGFLVEEIWSPQEPAPPIMDRNLRLRPRETA